MYIRSIFSRAVVLINSLILFTIGFPIAIIIIGCEKEIDNNLEEVCQLNSDCEAGLKCTDGRCIDQVSICTGDACPCFTDTDCELGWACDIEKGTCMVPECLRYWDCMIGQLCINHHCETNTEADRDRDGVPDAVDNCPLDSNSDQEDQDGDGTGDICDMDDDNDSIPDTIDNCPVNPNMPQGDADQDGTGNACDADTSGIDIRGVLNFSSLSGANVTVARVFVSDRTEPVGINNAGEFYFDDALKEPGRVLLRVEWPGFTPIIQELMVPNGLRVFDVPDIVLSPTRAGDDVVEIHGRAQLSGTGDHRDIVVRARIGGTLVHTTLTDYQGTYVMRLAKVNHTLTFSKNGYTELTLNANYNLAGTYVNRFTIDQIPIEETLVTLNAIPTATLRGEVQSDQGGRNDWPNIDYHP